MAGSIVEIAEREESHADRLFSTLRVWGLAEATLDMCLLAIMRDHDTRRPVPTYPATLERKLEYLAETHRIFPTLASSALIAAKIDQIFTREKSHRGQSVQRRETSGDEPG